MSEYAEVVDGKLVVFPETIDRLRQAKELKDEINAYQDEVRQELLELMRNCPDSMFKSDEVTISYKEPSTQTKVNTKKMIADGIYSLYTMEVNQKDSVQIKWNSVKPS